jgi:transposase
MVAAQGLRNVGQLIAIVRADGDTRLPAVARQVVLADQIEQIEAAITALERQLLSWHTSNPVSQRLASIPGIEPIIATAIATTVADPNALRSGREFAAWLGLVPRQNSTGGKPRLGASRSAATVICAGCSSMEQAPLCCDRRRRKPIHGPIRAQGSSWLRSNFAN